MNGREEETMKICWHRVYGVPCTRPKGHDGSHVADTGAKVPTVLTEPADLHQRDIGYRVGRLAHWLVNDRGYTKAMAARELCSIAAELLPRDVYEQTIGDAGKL